GALLRTAIAISNAMLIEQALTGVDRTATGNRGFNAAPGDIYRTGDGWIVVTVIGQPMFRRWCRMIGEEHWLADPRFADDQSRADHGEVISARMSQWCVARSCVEALAEPERASIVGGDPGRGQELHDPRRAPAYAGRTAPAVARGAAEGGRRGGLGRRQWRPLGKRRLHLRQEAAARDRSPHPLSVEAAGERRGGRPAA